MHAKDYLAETSAIALHEGLAEQIEHMAVELSKVEGRVYMIGLGGSLANCIHMAADLRKLCDIDAVAPDNIAEVTAWANDEGIEHAFHGQLRNITDNDALFVLSVGGGTSIVSKSISDSVKTVHMMGVPIFGIVGPVGGDTVKFGDCVIRIPVAYPKHVTPHTEAFQAVIWHALVSHPFLQKRPTKW